MADSYAYFQVAHKVLTPLHIDNYLSPQRIIDYVPLTIEHELNQTFVKNLQPLLFSSITQESATPGRLEELIQEDSAFAKRRRRLERRRTDLLKIKEKLDTFWSLGNVSYPTRDSQGPGSNARRTRSSSVSTNGDYHSIAPSVANMD
jgi:hypothetical protein